jgi:hypothetical protein
MNYEVKPIDYQDCKEWFLKKHYAKRIPSISYCFGLYDNYDLIGVCSIGKPASPNLCIGVCGVDEAEYVYELNRLIVNDGLPKNTLSFFVSRVIKNLPQMILVSYADTKQGHNGYIYQATNFIYTGATKERTDIGSEDGKHSRHYKSGVTDRKFRSSKHRYIYFIGKKKKYWISKLNYPIIEYPKGQNKRYDASYKPTTQIKLI